MNMDRNKRRREQREAWKHFKESVDDNEVERLANEVPAALTASVDADSTLCQIAASGSRDIAPTTSQVPCELFSPEILDCDALGDSSGLHQSNFEDFGDIAHCQEPSDDDSGTNSDSSSDSDVSDEALQPLHFTELHQLLKEVEKEDEDQPDGELSRKIAAWTLNHNVPHRHVDELLSILRGEGHPHLKRNIKTILKTPRKVNSLVRPLGKGAYYYHGLMQAMLPFLSEELCEKHPVIVIDVFADGLSPYKSVKKSVWPIVGSLVDSEFPCLFVIALWCGAAKDPGNMEEFFKDFVEEAKKMSQGFSWNGKSLKLRIRNYIADAPARSFLRCVLVHNSYDSCERCTSHGQWQGRVIFPYGAIAEPRTDASFASRDHPVYHTGNSPLEELGTKMVSQFPLDGMHLIYLGVMKRLLSMLLREKKASIHKLSAEKRSEVNRCVKSYASYCPSEFSRKPRALTEYKYFKATELRRILLYDGVLIYSALPSIIYHNFLLLHCAIRILSDKNMQDFYEDADHLLKKFVENAGSRNLYGPTFTVYNVHHLTHFADECKRCGPIEDFSAFKYENFIGSLKYLLKAPGRTLPQMIARIIEKATNLPQAKPQASANYELARPHQAGPLCGLEGQQFQKIVMQGVQLTASINDCCCSLISGDIVVIENFVKTRDDKIWVVGKPYFNKKDMYSYPMESSLLGIYKVSRPMPTSKWKIKEVKQKCMRLPISMNQEPTDSFLCIPMLQCFDFETSS